MSKVTYVYRITFNEQHFIVEASSEEEAKAAAKRERLKDSPDLSLVCIGSLVKSK